MARPTKKRRSLRNAYVVDEKRAFNLPLDVIAQVCQYLEPADILYLARTTKNLRAFLLDRNRSRFVWKAAFGNVPGPDLPPCPGHLSEPAYTHVAFVPECHGCFKYCDAVLWELWMRCCEECLPEMTVSRDERRDCPTQLAILHISRSVCLPVSTAHDGFSDVPCHRSLDWKTLSTHMKNMKCSIESFVTKERMLWNQMNEHAALCRTWHSAYLSAEKERVARVREERAAEIERRLYALGWTDDLYYSKRFLEIPAVKRPQPLTLAEWSEISSRVIASLPEVKLARMVEIYRYRVHEFVHAFRSQYHYGLRARPREIDLLLLPAIRRVLEGDLTTHMDNYAMQQKIKPDLWKLMLQWSNDAVDKLAAFAKQQLGPKSGVDPYNVVFTCTACQRMSNRSSMNFDVALSHEHLYPRKASKQNQYARMKESKIYGEVAKERGPLRSLEVLQVNKSASRNVERLSKMLACKFTVFPDQDR